MKKKSQTEKSIIIFTSMLDLYKKNSVRIRLKAYSKGDGVTSRVRSLGLWHRWGNT